MPCGLNRMQKILKKPIDTRRASSGRGIKTFSTSLQRIELEQWAEIQGDRFWLQVKLLEALAFSPDLGVRDPWVSLTALQLWNMGETSLF